MQCLAKPQSSHTKSYFHKMQEKLITQPLNASDYESFFEKGISYEQYMANMAEEVEKNLDGKYAKHLPINFQRSKRIGKTLVLENETMELLTLLPYRMNWLVISEHWCGDSSQILPVINELALASEGTIELRIVYRDENPQLMNANLTDGGRAIPKLIQLDLDFNIVGVWGPRPAGAQILMKELKSNPLTADTYQERLHKWYATDKTLSTQHELLQLLQACVCDY